MKNIGNARKGVGLPGKLQHILPRSCLLTTQKSIIRSHLDYGNVIYDPPSNATFISETESVQYTAALAITGAIRRSSHRKLHQ